ncbi:MAG: thiamine phosphate synthase [Cytophagaceae bacterium]
MKVIVISDEENVPVEHEILNALFSEGLEYLHLRKPNLNEEETKFFLEKIDSSFHKNIIIHQNYHLVDIYNLKGIHLKSGAVNDLYKSKQLAESFKLKERLVSYAAHSFQDVLTMKAIANYSLLSPVYNSISKGNYSSGFKIDDIKKFLTDNPDLNVVALGGVDEFKISELKLAGFSGVALLGAIWKQESLTVDKAVYSFKKIKKFAEA